MATTATSWKERRGLTVALLLAALVVWAGVGRAIWVGMSGEDEEDVVGPSPQRTRSERLDAAYVEVGRDPFEPAISLGPLPPPDTVRGAPRAPGPIEDSSYPELPAPDMGYYETLPPEPPAPDWHYRGRVGAQAILESGEVTVLARVGQAVGEGRVVALSAESIVIEEDERRYTFVLE